MEFTNNITHAKNNTYNILLMNNTAIKLHLKSVKISLIFLTIIKKNLQQFRSVCLSDVIPHSAILNLIDATIRLLSGDQNSLHNPSRGG